MQYAPTLTDQKFDSPLSIDSPARYVYIKYVLIESFSKKEFDHTCRGVLHTSQKCPCQWANELPTRYVSVKYVFVESYTRQKWVCLKTIESSARYAWGRMQYAPTLTDQKLDSSISIELTARYVSIEYILIESFSR